MSTNYAGILANKYHSTRASNVHGDLELAFTVAEILTSSQDLTAPWEVLLKRARNFTVTRNRRGWAQFRMAFKEALDSSDLLNSMYTEPSTSANPDREKLFRSRLEYPEQFSVSNKESSMLQAVEIAPVDPEVIITTDNQDSYREREDEFTNRLRSPASFRRGDKATVPE